LRARFSTPKCPNADATTRRRAWASRNRGAAPTASRPGEARSLIWFHNIRTARAARGRPARTDRTRVRRSRATRTGPTGRLPGRPVLFIAKRPWLITTREQASQFHTPPRVNSGNARAPKSGCVAPRTNGPRTEEQASACPRRMARTDPSARESAPGSITENQHSIA